MVDINNQMIYCPFCMAPLTIDELGEYANANPDTKKQAIAEQLQIWGDACTICYHVYNSSPQESGSGTSK